MLSEQDRDRVFTQATSLFGCTVGVPGEPPVRPNLSIGDTLAGMNAVSLGSICGNLNFGSSCWHVQKVNSLLNLSDCTPQIHVCDAKLQTLKHPSCSQSVTSSCEPLTLISASLLAACPLGNFSRTSSHQQRIIGDIQIHTSDGRNYALAWGPWG